jgi:hypothetical protein
MIMKPAAEWDVVAAEPATVSGLFTGYAMIVAAIPAVATLIGRLLFFHSLVGGVIWAVLSYVLTLVGVYVVALIVDALASSFDGERNQVQALKLVIYGSTAVWVAGIGNIVPFIGWLLVLAGGIYTLYTIYIGLPKLMKNPPDKTLGYFAVIIVSEIVLYWLIAMVTALIVGMFAITAIATGAAAAGAFH